MKIGDRVSLTLNAAKVRTEEMGGWMGIVTGFLAEVNGIGAGWVVVNWPFEPNNNPTGVEWSERAENLQNYLK